MSNAAKDLWAKINFDTETETPAGLLKYQADVLSRNTNGLLEGKLSAYAEHGVIFHTLYIVAPQLDGYKFALIRVVSKFPLYPAYVYDYSGVDYGNGVEVRLPGVNQNEIPNASFVVPDYPQFEAAIRAILSSQETANILRSLVCQSEALHRMNLRYPNTFKQEQ